MQPEEARVLLSTTGGFAIVESVKGTRDDARKRKNQENANDGK